MSAKASPPPQAGEGAGCAPGTVRPQAHRPLCYLNFTTSGAALDSATTSPLLFTVTLYMPTSLTASAGTIACSSLRLTNLVSSSFPFKRTRWNGQKPLPLTFRVVGPVPWVMAAGDTSIVCDNCCHELNSGIGLTYPVNS